MICATFGSVMLKVLYVIIAIVVLLLMVLIHELGHYIVGRLLGFTIVEFSIGFGKAIFQKKNKRGEIISLRIFPLGGYCSFLGEGDGDEEEKNKTDPNVIDVKPEEVKQDGVEQVDNQSQENTKEFLQKGQSVQVEQTAVIDAVEQEKSEISEVNQDKKDKSKDLEQDFTNCKKFNEQAPWKRILVFFAGVTFNFISAFIFAIIFLCVGAYDAYLLSPTEGYNVRYSYTTAEQTVEYGELQNNTLVYAINGKEINYARGSVFASLVKDTDTQIVFTIELGGEKVDVTILKEQKDSDGNAIFGINYSNKRLDYNFGDVLRDFIPFTFNISFLILKAFWQIITGQIAINQLGGPISTISQMTTIASDGLANFLYLLPLLAANLAIFNILPIPGLDGSHVVFTTIEWIRGKPIKRNVENAIHTWGILLLFAFVIIIDIVHLVTVG